MGLSGYVIGGGPLRGVVWYCLGKKYRVWLTNGLSPSVKVV